LTIVLRGKVQLLRVLAAGQRRGPPSEARQLYEALGPQDPGAPLQPPSSCVVAKREPGAGRPRKRDRRMMERFREPK
jgi:ribosome-associated heat shock protein Hsp15